VLFLDSIKSHHKGTMDLLLCGKGVLVCEL
jgi:hypothetical protein